MISTPGAASHPVADALVGFDFTKLVASAAKLRPDRPALCDSALPSGLGLTFAQLERAVLHSAALWRDLGVPQDARVLIVAGARVAPVVAMLGALHVGLDVVLASAHLTASEFVDIAEATGAVALCGEAANGGIDIADALFSAAALSTQVRYVAMLTDTPVDGAATIDIKTLRDQPVDRPMPMVARKGAILTVAPDGQVISHSQHALMAATVDFIAEARIGMRQPVISTLSVASFAGLVAGPLAGFMSGAQAFLHGPFESKGFRELLSFGRQANVVIPAAVAQAIIDAGLVAGPEIGALIPLMRCNENQHAEEACGPSLQLPRDCSLSIIDIFAFGESSLATKRRASEASALVPPATGRPVLKPLSFSSPQSRRAGAI
ncbi:MULTISPECIES: AMP-binding protein [unclassified Beijerinckia]|uniref:AMP-binding protein n=1 Tax=unclassified Beijerinckia TaxID=2638183 RepID=UPI00089D50EE|nr:MULTISPECIES: AMP-binding protein [unclassified Beijerinckia]MDH7796099.1 acyl-CoA synthetase (AMP-forming)/AMP-acid ligase II [Beijerinckia sp. GAS462]SEC30298.1 AMP-binding enzyme [Beijerinckia sp. 28-YEA-48]